MTESATLSRLQTPTGFVESTGRATLDTFRVFAHPGLRYWPTTCAHVVRLVRTAGPLAMLLCFFQGTFIVIQATTTLRGISIDPGMSGLIVSALGLRELVMISGTAAMGASTGAGFVTELGAMRVSEEIDAIEVMAIHSYPYLVSTRVVAAMIASVPIFAGCIAATFLGGAMSSTMQVSGLNQGSYAAWFIMGFTGQDVIYVMIKGVTASTIVAGVCASTGYRAKGGPVGVGMAVGEALNVTMVVVMIVNLLLSYLFWGISDTVKI